MQSSFIKELIEARRRLYEELESRPFQRVGKSTDYAAIRNGRVVTTPLPGKGGHFPFPEEWARFLASLGIAFQPEDGWSLTDILRATSSLCLKHLLEALEGGAKLNRAAIVGREFNYGNARVEGVRYTLTYITYRGRCSGEPITYVIGSNPDQEMYISCTGKLYVPDSADPAWLAAVCGILLDAESRERFFRDYGIRAREEIFLNPRC